MIITCFITWHVPTSLSPHILSIEVSTRVSSIIQNQTRAFTIPLVHHSQLRLMDPSCGGSIEPSPLQAATAAAPPTPSAVPSHPISIHSSINEISILPRVCTPTDLPLEPVNVVLLYGYIVTDSLLPQCTHTLGAQSLTETRSRPSRRWQISCGLRLPPYGFLQQVMETFGLQLHHLTPKGILTLIKFC